jgi:hypothetical protein
MASSYSFNPYWMPGVVLVVVEDHASYIAENFAQAETFVKQLQSDAPILLPAPSEVEALIARALQRAEQDPPVS